MKRLSLLVWLIALVAFVAPAGASAAPHQVAPPEQAALSDCPDHAPPPADPCPDQGTAKHAASACCPLMSGAIAVLPSTAAEEATSVEPPLLTLAHRLTGLTFTQDPPPPRV